MTDDRRIPIPSARPRLPPAAAGIVLVVLVLLLLPYLIAPLYRFVDPVSTRDAVALG